MVSWRHELNRRVRQRSLKRNIELGNRLLGRIPEEREIPFQVFPPNIVNEYTDIVIKALPLDQFKLSRRLVLGQGHSLGCSNLLRDLSQLPLCVLSPSL